MPVASNTVGGGDNGDGRGSDGNGEGAGDGGCGEGDGGGAGGRDNNATMVTTEIARAMARVYGGEW